jgi:hypothetical protein
LTVKNNKLIVRDDELLSNEKQVALTEEVPKLEYKTIDEYKAIVNPDSDTYYFVYDLKEENAWVTQASLENSYYTKS